MYYLMRKLKKIVVHSFGRTFFEYLLNESKETFNKYIEGVYVE